MKNEERRRAEEKCGDELKTNRNDERKWDAISIMVKEIIRIKKNDERVKKTKQKVERLKKGNNGGTRGNNEQNRREIVVASVYCQSKWRGFSG